MLNTKEKSRGVGRFMEITPNEVTDIQRMRFDDIMRNANPFQRSLKDPDHIVSKSFSIPLELLFVDERIQGYRLHKKIKNLIKNFDERKLGPIVVTPHPETCSFSVVDGKGRLTAAYRIGGITHLNAIILCDAPEDPKERLKFEAEYFMMQDRENEKVSDAEKHLPRLAIEDTSALVLEDALDRYNLTFVEEKGRRSKRVIGSYSEYYGIAKKHGSDGLEFIFSIIENAGWAETADAYNSATTRALRNMYTAYPEKREQMHKFLSDKLREYEVDLFISHSRATYPMREQRVAVTLYMQDLVCKELNIPKKVFHLNGKLEFIK